MVMVKTKSKTRTKVAVALIGTAIIATAFAGYATYVKRPQGGDFVQEMKNMGYTSGYTPGYTGGYLGR
jgi:hypothetical protein